MKNLFSFLFCALMLAVTAQAQTLTLDRTAVEVITAGAAAGTSPTIAIAGGTLAGKITLTTGSSPTTTGVLCTVTLPVTFPTGTIVNITAADSDSGAHIARIFVDSTT